ncbi:MAG: hypothetical protein KAT70_00415 [Thermoplasmata archaeon]|nr:hypothetical protein [Thermoplasmata archaeon]
MNSRTKKRVALFIIFFLLMPALFLSLRSSRDGILPDEEAPSELWVKRLVEDIRVESKPQEQKVFMGQVDVGSLEDDLINLAATPMLFLDGYNPLLLSTSDGNDAIDRFVELNGREVVDLPGGSAVDVTCNISDMGWEKSEAAIVVSNIYDALQIAPLAAYLRIPVLYVNGTVGSMTESAAATLGVRYCVAVGDAPRLSFPTMRLPSQDINHFYLWCMDHGGQDCNYMVVTNPDDMFNYSWGEAGKIPIPFLSLVSAQLAAYRHAPIFYTEGLDNLTGEGEEVVQMGASAEVVNTLAEHTREVVRKGKARIEERTGEQEAMYLALVGGPVALPFHYHCVPSSGEGTTFSNTDYIASDYYFGDLDEDYTMELAVGRIIARDIDDASVLVARSLLEDVMTLEYEDDGDASQQLYDTLSGPWEENSAIYVGSTRMGPIPRCLKHAKAYQAQTMKEGGFTPTALEAAKANDEMVSESIDKIQYCVYYGHGDYDCWWSNAGVYITSDMIASSRLKPGISIAMACLTARVDNSTIPLSELISLGFLHGGYNGYIGATRLAYGLIELYDSDGYLPVEDTDALYLVDRFTYYICKEDLNTGLSLMKARNDLVERFNVESEFGAKVAMYEYVLYGDPAYNMHVPALD